jgi:hypothetical protein
MLCPCYWCSFIVINPLFSKRVDEFVTDANFCVYFYRTVVSITHFNILMRFFFLYRATRVLSRVLMQLGRIYFPGMQVDFSATI